ncbi:MAG: hypothetical protein R2804_12815 [Cyclobacteriaceae bacterium]|jgi:hypothetical protein
MRKFVIILLLTLLHSHLLWSNSISNDSTSRNLAAPILKDVSAENRTFPELTPATQNLTFDPISKDYFVADSLQEKRDRAHSLREDVEKAQRFKETLDAYTVIDLPVGIVKSGGALDYSVIIDKITFNPQGSVLDAYVSFTIPQTGDRIAFGGLIPLSRDGGIVGTAKIYLLGDHFVKLSETSLLTLVGNKNAGTFVEIDCNGFKGMSIEAVVEFSKDVLKPEGPNGKALDERLKINFQTYVQDWNELLVKINIPPFQVNGLSDVGFQVQDAYLDWSDLTNPQGLAFPVGYESTYQTSGNVNLWRGFYLKKATVRLPNKLNEAGSGQRTAIGVENMIIDDTGFSGKIFAEHLVQAGDMNGWAFTLDRFQAGVVSNQLEEFEFVGMISVPAFKKEGKDAQMGYRASKGADDNYIFAVSLADEVKLPLWAADVSLFRGSAITVTEKNDKFYPSASLNGMLSIKALSKGPKATISGVRFENLILSTEAPYFRPGTFGVGSAEQGSKASGFPLVVKNFGVKSNTAENKVGLSMDVTINISGKAEDEGFSGTAGLIVWGSMSAPPPPATPNMETALVHGASGGWEFDKVELTAVGISIKKPSVYELSGQIRFYDNDPVYGDGFNGQLNGKFKDKIAVQANAIFGKTETYRYWFADALVEINAGVTLAPGFAAYSFGGGFYSKMKQVAAGNGSSIGTTSSGITYVPDENSLGLRAYMDFGAHPKKEAFNGDVTLEIAMNRHGGINSISFIGNAYFLTPDFKVGTALIKERASKVALKVKNELDKISPRSQVYGSVKLLFDNENDVFHGDIEVYVNVVGGIVKGIGEGNKAGWAVLHFASDDWYVLIGTPDQPIGLEVARIFKAKSYFMMGKNLPGSPPPPAKVSEILVGVDLDYMRDMNALQSGLGLAFGMGFSVDTGDLRFLMFYGRFAAGAGFDIMLKNYGTSYHCEGSNEPLGINGWYANGQAYAYVEGKIGIRVNLKFYKGDYDILAIGAAAVLQAKGPNPFWMRGTVGGYYRILGGLVKGKCRFEVTVGKECKPVGESNPLQDVAIIADMSPVRGTNEVDVFNAPQVAFNIPIGENFEITDKENVKRVFRANMVEFSVKDGTSNISGNNKWNSTNDVVVMNSHDILPPQKEIKAFVKVIFEERVGSSWMPVKFEGKEVIETKETSFTTGEAPDYIPASNVEYSYPIAGQYNFYPKEYNKGFIKLKKGQPYLFENDPKWIKKARVTEDVNHQRFVETDYTYDGGAKQVNYTIPDGLSLATIYRFELLNIPRYSQVVDANVEKVSKELVEGDEGVAQLTTKKLEGSVELLETESIYGSEFRTSKYETFVEKMRVLKAPSTVRVDVSHNVFQLASFVEGDELFDKAELLGGAGFKKLVQAEAILKNNNWYNNFVYPLVYEGYPLLGFATLRDRPNPNELGIPPVRDIYFDQKKNDLLLLDGQLSSDPISAFAYGVIRYNLMVPMVLDHKDIQNRVINYVFNKPWLINNRIADLAVKQFPWIKYGSYKFNMVYIIPGGTATSNYDWELFNVIRDN